MRKLTVPPYHNDNHVREALYEMALEATLMAERDFEIYTSGKSNFLTGDYLYQEEDSGNKSVYRRTSAGHYVYVGLLDMESEKFLPALTFPEKEE